MKLTLNRTERLARRTLGELAIDGVFRCYTLEDTVRPAGVKLPGATAIPAGTYPVQVTMSPRFGRRLPILLGVPGFTGIRIHPGNTEEDTSGCILVGEAVVDGRLARSRAAFDPLLQELEAEIAAGGSILIDIIEAWRA